MTQREILGSVLRPGTYEINPDTGCWDWLLGLDKRGYPYAYKHRKVWEAVNGPRPSGHHIHHRCENTRCVNPDHLEAIAPTGHFKHHHLDLAGRSMEDVAAVRADRAAGMKYHDIAAKHGISYTVAYEWCNAAWGGGGVALPVRICTREGCEQEITTEHTHAKYCSPKCRSKVARQMARQRQKVGGQPSDALILEALARVGSDWVLSREVQAAIDHPCTVAYVSRRLMALGRTGELEHCYHQRRQVNLYRARASRV